MKIIFAEISGFKCNKDKREFDFGLVNHIFGGNGKGKTTIAEAITWCFFGCDLSGNLKGIFDRLKNEHAKETRVVIGVEFSKNEETIRHNFCRVRKGDKTSLFIDGHTVKQADFDALLGRMEIFLSIFVPGYFGKIGALEPTKARNLLVSMLPRLDFSDVIEQLNEDDQERLTRIDMINPEYTLKTLRSEIGELNKSLDNIQGRIDILRTKSMLDVPMKVIEEDNRKLQAKKGELSKLMEGGSKPFQNDLSPLTEKKALLRRCYDENKKEYDQIKSQEPPQVGDSCSHCGHEYTAEGAIAEVENRKARLLELREACENLKEQGYALNEEMTALISENTTLQETFYKDSGVKMQALHAEIEQLQAIQAERKQKLQMADDLTKQHEIYGETVSERDEKSADMQAVRNFMLQYAEMQVEYVNSYLNKAEIKLFKYSDAGEMMLDFLMLYNGTEYKSLSTSEEIHCSIEFASLLNQVQGISYPVYIDNAESVETFDEPKTQYFVATVKKRAALTNQIVA